MFKSFFLSKENAFFAWLILIFLILSAVGQVYLAVQFNEWYKLFYDALQALNAVAFWQLMIKFSWLAALSIINSTASFYAAQHFTFRWRQSLTFTYLPLWQKLDKEVYEGSSQRIQEDTMRFAAIIQQLGLGTLKAIMTLIAFIPILWQLSSNMVLFGYAIPGLLVWVALISSIGGMLISWLVARKLPQLEYNNQKVEASFRKQLVYAEDNKQFADIPTLMELFTGLKANYFKLYNQYKYFTLWQNLYFQVGAVLPYLIGAASYFGKLITIGTLMQIGNAFDKVHSSFSYFLDNWLTVNELIAIRMRLREFEKTIGYNQKINKN